MTIGWLVRFRILPAALVLIATGIPGARAQDARTSETSGALRIYLLDRGTPATSLDDVAMSLTVRYRSGHGETVLLARTTAERPSGELPVGSIRGLVGSGGFVEMFWPGGSGATGATAPGEKARDALKRAHRGPCFITSVPDSRFGEVASVWITVRRGDSTWTSEEFQRPTGPAESEGAVLTTVDRTVHGLQDRANEGTTFMRIHPQCVILIAELAKLAPSGFMDDTGAFEFERQTCLGYARGIENSCAYGDWGQVAMLSLQCQPRVRTMEALHKEPEHPEVPTLDHQP
jgi:hypothetical protein